MKNSFYSVLNFIFLYCLCFMGCQADPGPKKYPLPEKQILNTVVDVYDPSIDILFIIDNSLSMASIQKLMAKNLELFISEFLDVEFIDYHIAVTSSSATPQTKNYRPYHHPGTGAGRIKEEPPTKIYGGILSRCDDLAKKQKHRYLKFVDRNTPGAYECLKEMMKVGTNGNTKEHFLDIQEMVLPGARSLPGRPAFYRPEAHLAIFVITDGSDHSQLSFEDSYEFLLDLKQGDETKIHYAIGTVIFEMSQYLCDGEKKGPSKIREIVKLFGSRGYQFNLCQFNYGKSLAEFASRLVDLVLTVPLNHLPDVSTIEVRYESGENSRLIPRGSMGWAYDVEDNAIHLSRDIELEEFHGKFNVRYEPLYTSSNP